MATVTLKSVQLHCPVCENTFVSAVVRVPKSRARVHTDLRKEADGIDPLHYGIHQCGRCGYAGRQSDFSPIGGVSYEVQRRVHGELTPRVLAGQLPMSEKYECAALVATWTDDSPLHVADLWLGAAWCCIDEGDVEAERFYRRHAARSFEQSLRAYHGVDDEERAMITYLVGELWRRTGDQARANTWFDRVPDEADPQDETWIRWARTQHDRPAEWFA